MKNYLLLFLLSFSFLSASAQNGNRGQLLSFLRLDSLDQQEIQNLYSGFGLPPFLAPITYSLEVYKVSYLTPAAKGDSLTTASGLVIIPISDSLCFPIFNYNHGTSFYGDEVSSLGFEWFLGVPFATGGYIMAMPDYLGYGDTPKDHPHCYIHAKTEASATIDMIRATRSLCDLFGVGLNDQLFLGGYSQGGHTTLATQREMEKNFPNEFKITAVASGSGPYDISNTSRQRLLEERPTSSFFLAFIMTSYQFVYENLWNIPSDVFVAPYDSIVPIFFDRNTSVLPNPMWPDTALRMLKPSFINALRNDSLHPANVALRDNDLLNWTPRAELRMYYCEADEVVPFQNALVALSGFVSRGATDVSAISINQTLGHTDCTFPTMLTIKSWFDSKYKNCRIPFLIQDTSSLNSELEIFTSLGEKERLIQEISLFPNPAQNYISVDTPEGLRVDGLEVWSADGKIIQEIRSKFQAGIQRISLDAYSSGVYWLNVKTQERSTFLPFVVNN
ncbi:MAG: T9SS type A sorting domain-containing protein [Bacteroidia bacterium]|nr:T9SS type A sorting domain-containing protein [Bacteroidia bacterium]